MSTARREVIPFLAEMTYHCTNRELTVTMAARYDMEEKHVAFVTGSGKTTNKVEGIVADAEERKREAAIEHSGGAFEEFASDSESGDSESEQEDEVTQQDESEPEPQESAEADSADEAAADDGQSGLGDFL